MMAKGQPKNEQPAPGGSTFRATPVKTKKKKSTPIRIRRVLVVLTVVALLLLGGALGRLILPGEINQTVVASKALATHQKVLMPDILGLDLDVARYVLADAGLHADINVESRPAAGKPNRVLEQKPAPRVSVDGPVALVVSEEARMPDFTGRPAREVREELDELGVLMFRVDSLDVAQPPGHVLATNPLPGEPIDNMAEVTVAAQGEGLSLLKVRTDQSGRWSSYDAVSINGARQSEALTLHPGDRESGGWWVIGRHVASMTATIGVSDKSEPGSRGRIRVLGDGAEIAAFDVRYGESQKIEVPLRDVLRLEIVAEADDDAVVVLGTPILRVTTTGAQELTS